MSKSVLVVEDNPDEAFMVKRALAKSPIAVDVVVVNNGTDAVKYLYPESTTPQAPDLILLDLKLPGMSGFDVLRKIKSTDHTRFVPVVILSSSELLQDRLEAYSAGAASFIRKPVSFGDLITEMDLVIRYWLILNHPLK